MGKGISGHLMAAILVIITGIIAVILFYIFVFKAGGQIEQGWSKLTAQFKEALCNLIPGPVRWLVGC
ncbi:MAG: hypothetical protein QW140_00415 [Candidatus Aenigmatarchaeota archaeon]